jgi:hypothetical protein
VVIEAFFACDKDEQVTANYLFVRLIDPHSPAARGDRIMSAFDLTIWPLLLSFRITATSSRWTMMTRALAVRVAARAALLKLRFLDCLRSEARERESTQRHVKS